MKIFNWKEKINEEELQECTQIINKGGIIVFPTDTVYGIGCSCFNKSALKKIYTIKDRTLEKPINILCSNIKDINLVSKNITPKEKDIIERYMPGALTIILNKNENVYNNIKGNINTVGVRIPDNNIAIELIKNSCIPLVTTSANISGETSLIKFKDVLQEFNNKVDVIIDGGDATIGVASTIIKIENNNINILRQGTIKFKTYYTYMIRCKDNSIYTGITTDLERRVREHIHKEEKCAKYTYNHTAIKLETAWKSESRVHASKLEYYIKKLNKSQKEELIKDYTKFEKILGEKLNSVWYTNVNEK